jgi:hypothetical protein
VVVGSSAAGTPEFHRNDTSMTRGSLRGVDEGESRLARKPRAGSQRSGAGGGAWHWWR